MAPVFRTTKLWLGLGAFILVQVGALPDAGEGGVSVDRADTDAEASLAALGSWRRTTWLRTGPTGSGSHGRRNCPRIPSRRSTPT